VAPARAVVLCAQIEAEVDKRMTQGK